MTAIMSILRSNASLLRTQTEMFQCFSDRYTNTGGKIEAGFFLTVLTLDLVTILL